MKVLLTYVSSLNGKITNASDPDVTKWNSAEDKEHFKKVKAQADTIVRSSKTYEISKTNSKAKDGQLMIVLTRNPEKYSLKDVEDRLEFTNDSPTELIEKLKKRGRKSVLLAIGGNLSAQFFQEGLIDEFHLTIEPILFGTGTNMIAETDFMTNLKLVSSVKLNEQGTLLLKYAVVKK